MITSSSRHLRGSYDVVVVGGGPAGLEAAVAAQMRRRRMSWSSIAKPEAGGILLQCIHSGFGLHRFGEALTGPEYAQRALMQTLEHDIDVVTDAYVLDIDEQRRVKLLTTTDGISLLIDARGRVGDGARERTRAPRFAFQARARRASSRRDWRSGWSTSTACCPVAAP